MKSLRHNRELENIIEVIEEMEKMDHEMVCEEHGEKLHLFCEEEDQLICWCCERSAQHKGHATALVEDVSQGYKVSVAGPDLAMYQLSCYFQDLRLFSLKSGVICLKYSFSHVKWFVMKIRLC
jgi:hypothetical protein